MSSFRRPTNTNIGDTVLYGGTDMHVITDMFNGSILNIPPVKFKSANGVTFWDGVLKFTDTTNEAFILTVKNPTSLTASRNLTLPSIAVNDTLVAANLTQTLTNKTLNTADNSLTSTSAVSGEILVHNGTKFVRLPLGTNVQFLRGDGVWATAPGQGGGEANTASNVGTAGVGVFKTKAGIDLTFKKINAASARVTITDDTTNDEVDIDVNLAGINLVDLGGTLTVAKGGTGATTLTGILKGNGTSAVTVVTAPSGTIVGTTDTQTLTTKTINTTDNTLNATSIATGDILKSNGTKFVRLARGTAGQVLKVNTGGTDVEWGTETGGSSGNTSTIYKNTTTVAVANTSTETNLLNQNITANAMGINGLLHIVCSGWYLNDSGGSETFTMRFKFGGTTLWEDDSVSFSDNTIRRPVHMEFWLKNMNSASSQKLTGTYMIGNASDSPFGFSDLGVVTTFPHGTINGIINSAINTTSTQALVISIDHSGADPLTSFNADTLLIELIT